MTAGVRELRWLLWLLAIVGVELVAAYAFHVLGWEGAIFASVVITALAVVAVLFAVLVMLLRRWHQNRWQMRLSSFLLGCVAISVLMGTVGSRLYRVRVERFNAVQLRRLGAKVFTSSREEFPRKRGWLAEWQDGPLDAEVEEVEFDNDDSLLKGIEYINGMPNVRHIVVLGPGITDSGLPALRKLGQRPSGLTVDVISTGITDRGLRELQAREDISVLCLNGGNITDEGLVHFAGMSQLWRLMLIEEGANPRRNRITDDGLAAIGTLEQLENLFIKGFDVTDQGLAKLSSLENLKALFVVDTRVTEEGAQELRAALPNCEIVVK